MKGILGFKKIKNQKELDIEIGKTYASGEYEALCWVKQSKNLSQEDLCVIENRLTRLMDYIGKERARSIASNTVSFN